MAPIGFKARGVIPEYRRERTEGHKRTSGLVPPGIRKQ